MVQTGAEGKWVCKPCHKAYMAAWHSANPKQTTDRRHGKCSKCGADKPKGEICNPCNLKWRRNRYVQRNGPITKGIGICRKCKGPRENNKHCKACRKEYLKRHYEADPQQYVDRRRKWRQSNPDAAAAEKHKRRSREMNAEGFFTRHDIAEIRKRQNGKCNGCGIGGKLTVDHIRPLARGGTNWPNNIQLLCMPCNARKHVKILN